jgi:hypothetical protein
MYILQFTPTGIEETKEVVRPQEVTLLPNYPNPFNDHTVISYRLPAACQVSLEIYNLLGEKVAVLVAKEVTAGYGSVNWVSRDLSSGIYFYKLTAGDSMVSRRMILLK